ncbi:unnamed protein product, partial [Ectocarpus sp. 12 AP-2014]
MRHQIHRGGAPNEYWLHLSTPDTTRNTEGERERSESRKTRERTSQNPPYVVTTAMSPSPANDTCREKHGYSRSVARTCATTKRQRGILLLLSSSKQQHLANHA